MEWCTEFYVFFFLILAPAWFWLVSPTSKGDKK